MNILEFSKNLKRGNNIIKAINMDIAFNTLQGLAYLFGNWEHNENQEEDFIITFDGDNFNFSVKDLDFNLLRRKDGYGKLHANNFVLNYLCGKVGLDNIRELEKSYTYLERGCSINIPLKIPEDGDKVLELNLLSRIKKNYDAYALNRPELVKSGEVLSDDKIIENAKFAGECNDLSYVIALYAGLVADMIETYKGKGGIVKRSAGVFDEVLKSIPDVMLMTVWLGIIAMTSEGRKVRGAFLRQMIDNDELNQKFSTAMVM